MEKLCQPNLYDYETLASDFDQDAGWSVGHSQATSGDVLTMGNPSLVSTHDLNAITSARFAMKPMLTVSPEGRRVRLLDASKRFLDIVGALGGLILLSLPMMVIALLIRLESPGPVIFRQKRMGSGSKPFWFLKFRTMVVDAEQRLASIESRNESSCGVLFKIKDDPRITKIGRFLRRSSLDELPQLVNILRGEMSLVGPRPLQLRDSEKLEAVEPEAYVRRLTVLPGLTGAWQVGGRSETDGFGMLQLDLEYVEKRSIPLDLMILARTVKAVVRGRGAY